MIDLTPLRFAMADAQRTGKNTVEIHYTELQALIHKVQLIQAIEEHIPKVFGYCTPDGIRDLCNSRERFGRIKRKPWGEYSVPVYFMGELPKHEKPIDATT
jgi:hypothetical protein